MKNRRCCAQSYLISISILVRALGESQARYLQSSGLHLPFDGQSDDSQTPGVHENRLEGLSQVGVLRPLPRSPESESEGTGSWHLGFQPASQVTLMYSDV